eukprot:TRINITY_DN4385_c0_g1_i3.p1 TRINITY_DN4385_c0_g1~~TRINITY_DN4385_c0_g1_i3.p1  ORF type:complete len:819 (-),score=227.56 TRINITY_DN4385_c0_g1_i3:90-2546(-)
MCIRDRSTSATETTTVTPSSSCTIELVERTVQQFSEADGGTAKPETPTSTTKKSHDDSHEEEEDDDEEDSDDEDDEDGELEGDTDSGTVSEDEHHKSEIEETGGHQTPEVSTSTDTNNRRTAEDKDEAKNEEEVDELNKVPSVSIRGKIGQVVPEEIGAITPPITLRTPRGTAIDNTQENKENSPLATNTNTSAETTPPSDNSTVAEEKKEEVTNVAPAAETISSPNKEVRAKPTTGSVHKRSASTSHSSSPPTSDKVDEPRRYSVSTAAQHILATASTMEDVAPDKRVRALYDFNGRNDAQLSLKKGDVFVLLKKGVEGKGHGKGWWLGDLNGKVGYFPAAYVEELPDVTPALEPASIRKEKKRDKKGSGEKKAKKKHTHKQKKDSKKNHKRTKSTDTNTSTTSSQSGSGIQVSEPPAAVESPSLAVDSDMKNLAAVAARPENTALIECVASGKHDILSLMSSLDTSSTPLEKEDGLVKSLRIAVADLAIAPDNRYRSRSGSDIRQKELAASVEKETTAPSACTLPPVKGRRASVSVDASDRSMMAPYVPLIPLTHGAPLAQSGTASRTTPTVIVYKKDPSPRPEEIKSSPNTTEVDEKKEDQKEGKKKKLEERVKSKELTIVTPDTNTTTEEKHDSPTPAQTSLSGTVKKRSLKRSEHRHIKGTLSSSSDLVSNYLSTLKKDERKAIPTDEVVEMLKRVKASLHVHHSRDKANISTTTFTAPQAEDEAAKKIAKLEAKITKAKKEMKRLKDNVNSSTDSSSPSTMATASVKSSKHRSHSKKHLKKTHSTGEVLKEKDRVLNTFASTPTLDAKTNGT